MELVNLLVLGFDLAPEPEAGFTGRRFHKPSGASGRVFLAASLRSMPSASGPGSTSGTSATNRNVQRAGRVRARVVVSRLTAK
jgi:hypothetical protein